MSSQRKKWNTNKIGDRYRLIADELTKLLKNIEGILESSR
jgi:hypothetical protein